jgi:hypothetical protein
MKQLGDTFPANKLVTAYAVDLPSNHAYHQFTTRHNKNIEKNPSSTPTVELGLAYFHLRWFKD